MGKQLLRMDAYLFGNNLFSLNKNYFVEGQSKLIDGRGSKAFNILINEEFMHVGDEDLIYHVQAFLLVI